MKKRTGIIASSVASIALCAAIVAGSTFALFTSESSVNVAITSAKVDVSAQVVESSIVKGYDELLTGANEAFTATYANGALSLANMAAGDNVSFDILLTNNSTIAVQYRMAFSVQDGVAGGEKKANLFDELDVIFGGAEGFGEDGKLMSGWQPFVGDIVENQPTNTKTISVTISLPYGSNAQDAGCTLVLGVEAIQGNAQLTKLSEELAEKMAAGVYTADARKMPDGITLDFEGEKCLVRISDEEAMLYYGHYLDRGAAHEARKADIANGTIEKSALEKKYFDGYTIWYASYYGPTTEVVIEKDMNFKGDIWSKPLEFYGVAVDGQDHAIKNVTIKATGVDGKAGLFSGSATLKNFTVENVHADATETTGNSSCGVVEASSNASIYNVTVKNSSAVGGKYTGGIVGYIYGTVKDCTLVNVTVDTFYKGGGLIGYQCAQSADGSKINHVLNNVLENVSVACSQVLAGKTPSLGVLVGNMNCYGNLIDNVATGFVGATDAIGTKDSWTHEIVSGNLLNGAELK